MFKSNTKLQLQIPEKHCVDRPLVGSIVVEASSEAEIKGIQLSFYGEAEVEYEYVKVEEDSEGKKTSTKEEFKKEKKFDKMKLQVTGPQKLPPGKHTFPFEIQLPQNLPASMKYKEKKCEIEIKYRMHAKILKGTLKADTKTDKTAIKILPHVPATKAASKKDTNKFMFGKGTSTVSVNIPDTTFALGSAITIPVECANESKKDNKKIKAVLVQEIKIKSGEKDIPNYSKSQVVGEAKAEGTGAKRETVIRELSLDTSKIPPSIKHPFIEIEYEIKASADYAWAKDPSVKFDVNVIPMQPKEKKPEGGQAAAATSGGNYTWSADQQQAPEAKPMMKAGGSQQQLASSQPQLAKVSSQPVLA